MTLTTLVEVALVVVGLVAFFRRRTGQPLMPESLWRVQFDDTQITVLHPRGERQVVAWSKLTKVAIRTTDDGPWDMDVFWGFHEDGSTEPLVYPGGATGEQEILRAINARLPGVRNDQIVKAMGSTSNAYFVVWESEKPTEMAPESKKPISETDLTS